MDRSPLPAPRPSSTDKVVLDDPSVTELSMEQLLFVLGGLWLLIMVPIMLGGNALMGALFGGEDGWWLAVPMLVALFGGYNLAHAITGRLAEWNERRVEDSCTQGSRALMDRVVRARALADEVSDLASDLDQHAVVVASEELRDDVERVVVAENEILVFAEGTDEEAGPGGLRHDAAQALLAQAEEVVIALRGLKAGLDDLALARAQTEEVERERVRRRSLAAGAPEVVLSGVATAERLREELAALSAGTREVEQVAGAEVVVRSGGAQGSQTA